MEKTQPSAPSKKKKHLKPNKRWNDQTSKKSSIYPQAYVRPQTSIIQIKSHVKNDI